MTKVVMLTGDCDSAAKAVAHELDLDDYCASVLPENKATYIQMLKDQGHTVIMVGDGINDTPALSKADVSILCRIVQIWLENSRTLHLFQAI